MDKKKEYEYIAIYEAVKHLGDWMSLMKFCTMAGLIDGMYDLKTVVEIGVFRGQSAIALAMCLKVKGKGVLHAIDPWCKDVATQGSMDDENREWWNKIPMDVIREEFLAEIKKNGLGEIVNVHEMTSDAAAVGFDDPIDFLHIDGNHTEVQSCSDVNTWCPKVRVGGCIVLDDTDWETTRKAQSEIRQYADIMLDGGSYKVYKKK